LKNPLVLASDRLRISFQRAGDRFGHTIEFVDGGAAHVLFTSLEGTPAEPWPGSPPFQEAHLEQRAGGRQVVLLVGMAGHSHWSGSAEIDPQSDSVVFDIACRMRGRAEWVGSRYEILGNKSAADSGQICLTPGSAAGGPTVCLQLAAGGDPAALLTEGSELRVALGAVESAAARTVRWTYTIRVVARDLKGQ
jgi:hypothetical protein